MNGLPLISKIILKIHDSLPHTQHRDPRQYQDRPPGAPKGQLCARVGVGQQVPEAEQQHRHRVQHQQAGEEETAGGGISAALLIW